MSSRDSSANSRVPVGTAAAGTRVRITRTRWRTTSPAGTPVVSTSTSTSTVRTSERATVVVAPRRAEPHPRPSRIRLTTPAAAAMEACRRRPASTVTTAAAAAPINGTRHPTPVQFAPARPTTDAATATWGAHGSPRTRRVTTSDAGAAIPGACRQYQARHPAGRSTGIRRASRATPRCVQQAWVRSHRGRPAVRQWPPRD